MERRAEVNKKVVSMSFFLLLLPSTMLFSVVTKQVLSQEIAVVDVLPSNVQLRVGDSFNIDINLSYVEDLYSFEFKLSYNTTVLDTLNVTVPPLWPTPLIETVEQNGYIRVNSSLTTPPGITGNLTLASITFKATEVGNTKLDLYNVGLLNSTLDWIAFIVHDGFVSVPPLRVPTDYPTIQEAINAANSGDTIFVYTGIYNESLVVNKTVTLLGENRDFTIINSSENNDVLQIAATDVYIKGFTLQGTGNSSGVYVGGPFTFTLIGNNIKNNLFGVYLAGYGDNTIIDNNISNNNIGIFLNTSNNNAIISNDILSNNFGITSSGNATNNLMDKNYISNNSDGIHIVSAYNHTITDNDIFNNTVHGIYLNSSTGNIIYHNNLIDNADQVSLINSVNNTWDNGYTGNYWSNYNGSDFDGDGIGDEYIPWESVDLYPLMSPYIPGDVNHDGIVDSTDYGILGSSWPPGPYNPHCDFNNDGVIDSTDLGTLGLYWGWTWP